MPWVEKVVKLRSKKTGKIVGRRVKRVFVLDPPAAFKPTTRVLEIGARPLCALGIRERGPKKAEEADYYCRVKGTQGVFRYECRAHQAGTQDEIALTFKVRGEEENKRHTQRSAR